MPPRSYRAKIFLALFLASLLPVVVIGGVGWVLVTNSPGYLGQKNDLDAVKASWRQMDSTLIRDPASVEAKAALKRHETTLNSFLENSYTAINYFDHRFIPVALVLLVGAILLGWAIVGLMGLRLSRQLSSPLDELVRWTSMVRRGEQLPQVSGVLEAETHEFVVLQNALREMQDGLLRARRAEIEAERLHAFGEVARRVAHEMKNPLTPIRLAVAQLNRTTTGDAREMLEIIATESARLEAMAREFSQLGRLPDGVAAPVDLRELLDELLRSTVPADMNRELVGSETGMVIEGYYDPLRRAFSNLLRNAVEACGPGGTIRIALECSDTEVTVTIADSGHGVPEDRREQIFLPYFTDKGDGTGLGLALVRQTVELHHGTITVSDTPGGGATFLLRFPI